MPHGWHHPRGRTAGGRRLLIVPAAILLLATACTDSTSDGLVTSVEVDAAPHSEHIPIVTVDTADSATVTVTATSGDHKVVTPASKAGKTHEVPILGLRTDRDYELSVTTESENGVTEQSDAAARYKTPPLPKGFPHLELRSSDPEQVAPGILLIPLVRPGPDVTLSREDDSPRVNGRVVGVDESGEVVWYYESKLQVLSVAPTSSGTILLGIDDNNSRNLDASMREIDMLGNTVDEWSSRVAERSRSTLDNEAYDSDQRISVDTDSMHHDVHELPNGNLIALSTELLEVGREKGREMCPANPVGVIVSDVVVEFERGAKVVSTWPVAVFDPATRPGSEMCLTAPDDAFYPGLANERDWTHANALAIDEANNTLLVSLRHLNSVIALRFRDDGEGPAGELLWELGPEGDLEMQGDGLFQYHQHAVKVRDDGTLMLFDNGNLRPGTTDGGGKEPAFSRAVIYKVDPDAGTVEQVWEHRDESPWGGPTFVPFMGDADPLPNGNALITYSVIADPDQQPLVPYARIVEVHPDIEGGGADDEVVFDLLAGSGTDAGWAAYHSEKLPSLYFGS